MKTIEQTKKIPVIKRTVQEEYRLARHEKRQPFCVYCGASLEIEQQLFDYIEWGWNIEKGCYEKFDMDGDAEKPRCSQCQAGDWDFVDEDMVSY